MKNYVPLKTKSPNLLNPATCCFSMQHHRDMFLNPSDDRTATRFSSADSFLVWWRSSHSSPNQSRSPSPNQFCPPQSTSRSRSLSPILPSAERFTNLPSKATSFHDCLKTNSKNQKKDKFLSTSFSNFLRQHLVKGSKGKKNTKVLSFAKPVRSISLENLSFVPIEVYPNPSQSTRRLFMLDRQISSKKKHSRGLDDSFLDIQPIPLTLYRIENGRFSAIVTMSKAPKNVHKIIIEIRGFVADVEFSLQSDKKHRKPSGSFIIKSPEASRTKMKVRSSPLNSSQLPYDPSDSKSRWSFSSRNEQDAILTKEEEKSPIKNSNRSSFSVIPMETHFKLSLPIFADTSSFTFDWNQGTKSLLVSGAVKGCSHIPQVPITSKQRMTLADDFFLKLNCCNTSENDNSWLLQKIYSSICMKHMKGIRGYYKNHHVLHCHPP